MERGRHSGERGKESRCESQKVRETGRLGLTVAVRPSLASINKQNTPRGFRRICIVKRLRGWHQSQNSMGKNKVWWGLILLLLSASGLSAAEADINIPDLSAVNFPVFGKALSGLAILWVGLAVCVLGVIFGLIQYKQTKALPVHKRMGDVSNIIWETCKTYLMQQG